MSILSDQEIMEAAYKGMISPFEKAQQTNGKLSYGLSSYGYDARLGNNFKIFTNAQIGKSTYIDPKKFQKHHYINHNGDDCMIPPGGFVLGHTFETFCLPRNILAICIGKSTYARCGIIVNVTPLEPESKGQVTLEFSNTTPLPVKLYALEGVCQFLFFEGKKTCKTSYKDREGKYMNQSGVHTPRLKHI